MCLIERGVDASIVSMVGVIFGFLVIDCDSNTLRSTNRTCNWARSETVASSAYGLFHISLNLLILIFTHELH